MASSLKLATTTLFSFILIGAPLRGQGRVFLIQANTDPTAATPGLNSMVLAAPGGGSINVHIYAEIDTPGEEVGEYQVETPCTAAYSGGGTANVGAPSIGFGHPDFIYEGVSHSENPSGPSCPTFEPYVAAAATGSPPVVTIPRFLGSFSVTVPSNASGSVVVMPSNDTFLKDENGALIPITMDGVEIAIAGNCDMGGANCIITYSAQECSDQGGTFYGFGSVCSCSCSTDADCRGSLCVNKNACNIVHCVAGSCSFSCGSAFGDTNGTNGANLDDILAVIAAFSNGGAVMCPNCDLMPCGGNGIINVDDILRSLAGFNGQNLCGCNTANAPVHCGSNQP